MEDKPGYQDMRSTSLFADLGWIPDYMCIWPWDDAPELVKKYSKFGGDEDAAIWVPNKFLSGTEDPRGICHITHPIERLWNWEDDAQWYRFSDGMLIIWSHA